MVLSNDQHLKRSKNKQNIKKKLHDARQNLQNHSVTILSPPSEAHAIISIQNSQRNQFEYQAPDVGYMTSRRSKLQTDVSKQDHYSSGAILSNRPKIKNEYQNYVKYHQEQLLE